LPSLIANQSLKPGGTEKTWFLLIQKWLTAVKGLERHHGSRGNSVISLLDPSISFKSLPEQKPMKIEDNSVGMETENKRDRESTEDDDRMMVDDERLQVLQPDGSDDEVSVDMVGDMEMENSEEEMVGFAEQALGETFVSSSRNSVGADAYDDSSEDGSFDGDSGPGTRARDSEREFAFVSRSPIIPHQPSLLGTEPIGPGTRGAPFEVVAASAVMRDLSYLGMAHRKGKTGSVRS
jgi:hypothetical protein